MSRAGGLSWFHLHDCKSATARCHLYTFGFGAWLVFNDPTVLVGNPGLVQCTAAVLWEHWAALAYPGGAAVNTATASAAVKWRRNSWMQHPFRDLCLLAFKRDEYARNSWDETLQEWCLIMMKILSFTLMLCSVILSAHSAKNCSLGKLQPLKAFGDFKPGRMIFLFLTGVEIQHFFTGLRGKGGGTKTIGSGSPGSLPGGNHHFWI